MNLLQEGNLIRVYNTKRGCSWWGKLVEHQEVDENWMPKGPPILTMRLHWKQEEEDTAPQQANHFARGFEGPNVLVEAWDGKPPQ